MKILVVEFFLAGLGGPIGKLPASLVREARAMLQTLLDSLALDPNLRVRTLLHPDADLRLSWQIDVTWAISHPLVELKSQLCRTDFFWPVAPETDGHLQAIVKVARQYGVETFAPEERILELARDKWQTYEHLKLAEVPTPRTVLPGSELPGDGPWVVKPRDGVGSQGVRLIRAREEVPATGNLIIQEYCPGTDISQALVGGQVGVWYLPPCRQILEGKGSFEYLGGETPLDAGGSRRAERLSRKVAASLGRFSGWMGLDMVLGSDPDGADDRVIEINPRLTTSFVGLNRLALEPLGPAAVRHALGYEGNRPEFGTSLVRFSAMGETGGKPSQEMKERET